MNSNSIKSPQLEDGYTRIANELMEAISLYPFTGGELRVLIVILRSTYGYKCKATNISLNELARRTNLTRRHIPNILKNLKNDGVITVTRLGNKNVLGINKHYFRWALWIKVVGETAGFHYPDELRFPERVNCISPILVCYSTPHVKKKEI